MKDNTPSTQPLRVLQTVVRPSATNNPFVSLMVQNMPKNIQTQWFSWRRLLSTDFDVLHVQWPEKLVTGGSFLKGAAKRFALRIALRRARLRGRGILLTVHNLQGHEKSTVAEARALRRLYRQVDEFVVLNESVALTHMTSRTPRVIPHGNYAQLYGARDPRQARSGHMVFVGTIREYKNVTGLLRAFHVAASKEAGLQLTIAGRPWTSDLEDKVRDLADGRDDVDLQLRELADSELTRIMGTAEIIVLPYVQLYNSGVVFLALTLGVPVLVPRTPATTLLQEEFGDDWIRIFDGFVSAEALLRSRRATIPTALPDLSRYDWESLSHQYADLYKSLRP